MSTAIFNEMAKRAPLISQFDLAELEREDEYKKYFSQMEKVCRLLVKCYDLQEKGGNREAKEVERFLTKLLYTMETLKMKYSFDPDHSLKLDLTESGFPNQMEINALSVDLTSRTEKLRHMPAKSILKRAILDRILSKVEEPTEELLAMSRRAYFEMLDENELLLKFTPGEITLENTKEEYRSYIFTWACWDFQTNRPYIHVMTLHQDANQEPLEKGGETAKEFIRMIKAEGSRAPDVGVLAMAIDEAIETLHPKIIKRICLGPLYARFLIGSEDVEGIDYCNDVIAQAMVKCGLGDDDFVLLIEDNIIFSPRQKRHRGLLSLGSRIREVFHIPESDPDCYSKRASVVHRYALMPHKVCQFLNEHDRMEESGLDGCKIFTYDEKEKIHGI